MSNRDFPGVTEASGSPVLILAFSPNIGFTLSSLLIRSKRLREFGGAMLGASLTEPNILFGEENCGVDVELGVSAVLLNPPKKFTDGGTLDAEAESKMLFAGI